MLTFLNLILLNMKIRLLDYLNEEFFCEIPDNTEEITIQIISGDMVLIEPIHFDTSTTRIDDFDDGTYVIPKNKFHILNKINTSYDLEDYNLK